MPAARRAASTPSPAPKAPASHAEVAASPIPDDTLELHAEPGHLMRRAHQIAVSTFHETHGRQITPVQYAILRALQDNPGIDQVTLAQRVALDTSTTADIATRLESKGWIARELLPRRQRSLTLTAEGQAVLDSMLPHVNDMYRQLLQPLDVDEQIEFLRLLRKFVRLAGQNENTPRENPDG